MPRKAPLAKINFIQVLVGVKRMEIAVTANYHQVLSGWRAFNITYFCKCSLLVTNNNNMHMLYMEIGVKLVSLKDVFEACTNLKHTLSDKYLQNDSIFILVTPQQRKSSPIPLGSRSNFYSYNESMQRLCL